MKKFQKTQDQLENISEDEVDLFHRSKEQILFDKSKNTLELEDLDILKQTEVLPLYSSSEEEVESQEDESTSEADIKAWGRKKRIFYSSDNFVEKEELSECIRLQKLQNSKLKLSDYYFPGLLNPDAYYQKVSFNQHPTSCSYFKNGKFIENTKDIFLITKSGKSTDLPNIEEEDRISVESESETYFSSQYSDNDGQLSSEENQAAFETLNHSSDNDSNEDYYEYISTLKKKKEPKDNGNSEPVYNRYNDIDSGKKRKVTYEILRNKGLLPTRTKEQRNPRVKQRKRYERAMKNIKGFKPIVNTSLHGATYSGERTGIRTNIVKSTLFK